jgi:drug/metabolite transporter (DMT)-like permease
MSSSSSRLTLAHALLFITPALWAVNYVVARKAPGVIEPHTLAFARWGLVFGFIAVLARVELRAHAGEILAQWRRFVVLGALGMGICGAWVYLGARTTTALNIALIYALSPVLIALASTAWLGETMRRTQVLGVALAFAGVLHVVLKGQWAGLASVRLVPGDLWIAACTCAWAAYSLLLRKWPSSLSPLARLAATALGGVLVLLPFTLWELAASPVSPWSWPALGLAGAAAVFPGLLAYWAYSVMQRELGAARVGVTLYLGPLYAALFAWGLLGEPLQLFHLLGALLILPGLALVMRSGR